jgi:hypothetical protein
MPLWVSIRGAPMTEGDSCPVFNPAVWWRAESLIDDIRFRLIDGVCHYSIACLSRDEMRDLQERFRFPYSEITKHWMFESDRLDSCLSDEMMSGRWWVVAIYEWESGID